MTRQRLIRPIAALQRPPEAAVKSRVSSRPAQLEIKRETPKKLAPSLMLSFALLIICVGCSAIAPVVNPDPPVVVVTPTTSHLEAIALIAIHAKELRLERVEVPDELGRLGRNKQYKMYSSADWQRGGWIHTEKTVLNKDAAQLNLAILALEFAFDGLQSDGSFGFNPLPIAVTPEQQRKEVCSGGCYFFLANFGSIVSALTESAWFQSDPANQTVRDRLAALKPKVLKALDFIGSDQNLVVLRKDVKATNRIFFRAMAFYGAGKFVGSQKYQDIGLEFARKAYSQINLTTGVFSENGGGDSSYQGINLINASLFSFMLPVPDSFRSEIQKAVQKGAAWELSRIETSGQVSTVGNTRVYPGGESFLGVEKGVNIPEVVRGLAFAASFSDDASLWDAAKRVSDFDFASRK